VARPKPWEVDHELWAVIERLPPKVERRPRRRSDVVLGDRGYDRDQYRRLVRDLGVKPLIAHRGTEHGSGLGAQRWVVERAFAHLHWFRRLRIRRKIRDDIHEAFLALGCALIRWRRLNSRQKFKTGTTDVDGPVADLRPACAIRRRASRSPG
jgi:transposase